MIVHVVLQGLFAILGPAPGDPGQVLFLDPTEFTASESDTSRQIPPHALKIRFEGSGRVPVTDKLELPPAVGDGPVKVMNIEQFVALPELVDDASLRPECRGPGAVGSCTLNDKPLVRFSLDLHGGEMRPCESIGGRVFFDANPDSRALSQKYFLVKKGTSRGGPRGVFGSALFSYETASSKLVLGDRTIDLKLSCPAQYPELAQLNPGKNFTVLFLVNDATAQLPHDSGNVHLGVFYQLLAQAPPRIEQAQLVGDLHHLFDEDPEEVDNIPPRAPTHECIPIYAGSPGDG